MAVKIRCTGCRKKISVDEAFAGGVCRCPYCGATSPVPSPAGVRRPAPRPDRPDVPGAARPGPAPSTEPETPVPVARPVLIQGVVAIVLAGLLVAMLAGAGVLLAMLRFGSGEPEGESPAPATPMVGVRGTVAGMPVKTPVVFLIDGANAETADISAAMVRHFVLASGADDRFNLLFIREEGVDVLSEQWVAGGADGDGKAKAFLTARVGGGATQLAAAFERAAALKPASIVLLGAKGPADPEAISARLREAGIVFFGVNIGGYEADGGTMKTLADVTGGRVRPFTMPEIQQYITDAPSLP